MKKRVFTAEEKQQILNDYNNRSLTVVEIREKWKLSNGKILNDIIEELGGEFRIPKAHKPHSNKGVSLKTCPKCHKKIDVKGAKYCPYCGADIRSEKDLLIEKVSTLYSSLMLLPATERDKAQTIIGETLSYLRKS